ncbi:NUDIX hydrolase [Neisseria animalis]|uniref:NUDIX domain-containing protein n=1 Tax=Neisseria animalis TaxID=492 RepID=A0A5P3MRC7_NEIAN|nr:NUDIX domain-containing protein [Neisseria animalis]QEY24000.1 NUDIX domain-containing protein [Neisseria animalis]ROW32566.1 NUDIX domain-containing protein [Neisseria animalis]VEE06042.1 Thiamin pyrophosphokinase-related protein [Neisseria animalis]
MSAERPLFPEPLGEAEHQTLLEWIRRAYGLYGSWQTLWLNGKPLGRLSPQWAAQVVKDWHGEVNENADGIALNADSWLALGDGLQHLAFEWKRLGLLHGWRDERFDVCDSDGSVLFALERAAFRPLGLLSHAVHLNGLTYQDGAWRFWIGRRSPHKAVDPDKLDNLVGGGISSGEDITAAMLRESEEEAGLTAQQLSGLTLCNRMHSLRPVARGLHNEILHIFDVILPSEVRPENLDGEVAGFELFTPAQIVAVMAEGAMMPDAQLVTLDAFRRYGLLRPEHELTRLLQEMSRPVSAA